MCIKRTNEERQEFYDSMEFKKILGTLTTFLYQSPQKDTQAIELHNQKLWNDIYQLFLGSKPKGIHDYGWDILFDDFCLLHAFALASRPATSPVSLPDDFYVLEAA